MNIIPENRSGLDRTPSICDRIKDCIRSGNLDLTIEWGEVETIEDVAVACVFGWVKLSDKFHDLIELRGDYETLDSLELSKSQLNAIPNKDLVFLLCAAKYDCYFETLCIIVELENYEDGNNTEEYHLDPEFLKNAWKYAVSIGAEFEHFGDTIRKFYTPETKLEYEAYLTDFQPSKQIKSSRSADTAAHPVGVKPNP